MPRRPSVSETTTGLAMDMASEERADAEGVLRRHQWHDHDRGPVVELAQLEVAERPALDPVRPSVRPAPVGAGGVGAVVGDEKAGRACDRVDECLVVAMVAAGGDDQVFVVAARGREPEYSVSTP